MGDAAGIGPELILKAFAKRHKKNDKIDSRLCAWLLLRRDFPAIAHPPKEARARRDLYRQRMELVSRRTSAISRGMSVVPAKAIQLVSPAATMEARKRSLWRVAAQADM